MRTWIGGTSPVWTDQSWQIYALPRDQAVLDIAANYRRVVETFSELSPVADSDLHMTVQPLPGWSAEYSGARLETVLGALRAALADAVPPTVTVGGAVCGSAGTVLDVDCVEGGALAEVYRRVRGAVADTAGEPPSWGWPGHISLGYARVERDSGDVQSRLRRVRAGPIRASWTISSLHLVDVRQDPEAHTYTWRSEFELPLGRS